MQLEAIPPDGRFPRQSWGARAAAGWNQITTQANARTARIMHSMDPRRHARFVHNAQGRESPRGLKTSRPVHRQRDERNSTCNMPPTSPHSSNWSHTSYSPHGGQGEEAEHRDGVGPEDVHRQPSGAGEDPRCCRSGGEKGSTKQMCLRKQV